MKYVFMINPLSGKRRKQLALIEKIKAAAKKSNIDYEILLTENQEEMSKRAVEMCKKNGSYRDSVRIYGCGGDGTLHDIVNAVYGCDNVEVGIIPAGTGNDFIRNFAGKAKFLDIDEQISAKSAKCDLIYYRGERRGKTTEGYCVNMFNIGFDSDVVYMTERIKKLPFISGHVAYLISVFLILVKKRGIDLTVRFPDDHVKSGKVLLTTIGNGAYCGGGIKGLPEADPRDGFMDVSVVEDMTRIFFMQMFPHYKKGTHLEKKQIISRNLIRYTKEKTIWIRCREGSFKLCTDGEISLQEEVTFKVIHDAFNFIIPNKGTRT